MEIQIDHVGLSVADIAGAEAFYAEAFGFTRQLAFELAPHPIRGLMLGHPNGMRLELFAHAQSRAGVHDTTPIEALRTRGYGHFALAAPDIDPVYAAALQAGAVGRVPPSPSPEPGVRFAFLSDPEGNLVELVELPAR